MITKLHSLLIGLALAASLHQAAAQGTAFTYQGRLNDGTNPANGQYDFQFQVFDAATAGASYGSPNPNTVAGVGVSNGLFTVTLDFGGSVFTGPARWLQTSVRTNGSASYTLLNARQPLTATPYAIYAGNAATLGGQASTAYVAKTGDTMTGTLNLPANGLNVGSSQLVAINGNIGIGTASPAYPLDVNGYINSTYSQVTATSPTVEFYSPFNNAFKLRSQGHYPSSSFTITDTTFGELGWDRLTILGNGNVGIGTTSPGTEALVVAAGVDLTTAAASPGSDSGLGLSYESYGGRIQSFQSKPLILNPIGNNVGIGTTTPSSPLHVQSAADGPILQLTQTSAANWSVLSLANSSGSQWYIDEENGSTPGLEFYANNNFAFGCDWSGTFTVKVLQITGGSDIAEPFNLSTKDIPKGAVVVIDENVPGQLKLSGRPYDTRVAGIISGANGINPGLSLHQQGALEGGENVALSGRVYALADASLGAINPGDLLTTSSTPGHCMKVTDHAKAQGAIIGKAMSSLEKGKGMVLVLVSLQ